MANLITSWREALVSYLTVEFPDAEVLSGERSGVSRDKPRISVFMPADGLKQFDRDGAMATVVMIVRYWPKRGKQPAPGSPVDPTGLEQAVWDLATALEPVRSSGLSTSDDLTFEVSSIEPDYDPDEWGVEATLVGWTSNPAGAGA